MSDVLKVPLQLGADGQLATVPQDSDEDVAQCLLAIGRTRPGDRWDEPSMGIAPQQFAELPLDVDELARALGRYESRRPLRVLESTPTLADVLAQVAVELTIEFAAGSTTDG